MIHAFAEERKVDIAMNYSVGTWTTLNPFWMDMSVPEHKSTLETFIKTIDEKMKPNVLINHKSYELTKHLIVDGHFNYFKFPLHHKYEYVQLARDCRSRRRSLFFYNLFDHNLTIAQIMDRLKVDESQPRTSEALDKCLNDYNCLKKNNLLYFPYGEERLICGKACQDSFGGNLTEGVLHNLRDPSVYTVIGSDNYFEHFFEMLECAYPLALKGILDHYKSNPVHLNEGGHRHNTTDAIERLLDEGCVAYDSNNVPTYETVFKSEFVDLAEMRYRHMKKNKAACCRHI